jgi:hypothetical protein
MIPADHELDRMAPADLAAPGSDGSLTGCPAGLRAPTNNGPSVRRQIVPNKRNHFPSRVAYVENGVSNDIATLVLCWTLPLH